MSIDGMGRVIVGSGHFAENAGQIIANVQPVVNMANHIVVGGGHNQFIENATQTSVVFNQALETVKLSSIPDPHFEYQNEIDYKIIPIKKHKDSAEQASKAAEKVERYKDRLERLGEGGVDIGMAFGMGAAGDLGGAYEKAVDGAWKMGSVFWDGLRDGTDK